MKRSRVKLTPDAIAAWARLVAAKAGDRQLSLFAPVGARGAEWSRAVLVEPSGAVAGEVSPRAANDEEQDQAARVRAGKGEV